MMEPASWKTEQRHWQMVEVLSKMVQSELSGVSVTTNQLKQLTGSSAAIKQGITDAYNGAAALQESLSYENYKADLVAGLEQLKNSYDEFDAAIGTMVSFLSDLTVNISTLKDAIDQLTDSYENLDSEIGAYTDGMDSKIEDELDDMLDSIAGGDAETTSFVSDKNGTIDFVALLL